MVIKKHFTKREKSDNPAKPKLREILTECWPVLSKDWIYLKGGLSNLKTVFAKFDG